MTVALAVGRVNKVEDDAEAAVLSAMLMEGWAVARAVELLDAKMFSGERHRLIFAAARALYDAGTPLDPVTLAEELDRRGTLKTAGGQEYIGAILFAVPTAANVEYHAKIVKEQAERRRLEKLGIDLAREAASGKMEPAAICAAFKGLLDSHEQASADGTRPYRLYSAGELDSLPPAEWIVADAIPQNGIVGVIGPKGTKKTFAVLDLALHVATGKAWHGRTVKQRAVAYVYAEGPFGAKARIEAWCQFHGIDRNALPLWLLPKRLPMNDAEAVAGLLSEIAALPSCPALVVIDTLNQNLDGDEDGTGMGGFVRGCSMIRDRLGACVLAVHHTPLGSDERGRGHSSFDGALDTRLMVSCDAERVTIECTHQRNAAGGWAVAFECVPVGGSLVLKPSAPDGGQLKGQRRELLELLPMQGTVTYSGWLKASELKSSSFRKARTWLLAKAYAKKEGKCYAVTASGSLALGHQGHREGHHD